MKTITGLPMEIQEDIATAAGILVREGCREVYLFGSIAEGRFNATSDLDIAAVGLAKEEFFRVYGELLEKLNRPVDLVGLDYETPFSRKLLEKGSLTRVA